MSVKKHETRKPKSNVKKSKVPTKKVISITAKDVAKMKYYPLQEDMLRVLSMKTQQSDKMFFRLLIAFYLGQIASSMRCKVNLTGRGAIPVNSYVVNLASSGFGKGHSTYILNEQMLAGFRAVYLRDVFPTVVEERLREISINRAIESGTDEEDEFLKLKMEFEELGELLFSFDSATTPAIKQFRSKLILGATGAITFVADEIGSSLSEHSEILKTFLELYDMGHVGDKLIKNTGEQVRSKQRMGSTPANMLLFGTQSKLFDGGKNEELMASYITTGFARRCLFGYADDDPSKLENDPEILYAKYNDSKTNKLGNQIHKYFKSLADEDYHDIIINMDKKESILLLAYEIYCKKRAAAFPESFEEHKAHFQHASFRVCKLAATYAFADKSPTVTVAHLHAAIKLNEDSMNIFVKKIMVREKPYVKLAKYIGSIGREVTHADLDKELTYYPKGKSDRDNMIQMAIAWGYSNHVVLTNRIGNGIEFISGKTLEKTSLKRMYLSYNNGRDMSDNFTNQSFTFNQLAELSQYDSYNFVNHHLTKGHRSEKSVVKGFNFVVLDVDDKTHLETVLLLLEEYNYIVYTTKSHNKSKPRFRVILPLSHKLLLKKREFGGFMNNLYKWLPFDLDTATKDRSRKWLTNQGKVYINKDGKNLQAINFIPKSSQAKQFTKVYNSLSSLTSLERWFAKHMKEGNRSYTLIRYALALVEQGLSKNAIRVKVLSLNNTMNANKLSNKEINRTIMQTVKNRLLEVKSKKKKGKK